MTEPSIAYSIDDDVEEDMTQQEPLDLIGDDQPFPSITQSRRQKKRDSTDAAKSTDRPDEDVMLNQLDARMRSSDVLKNKLDTILLDMEPTTAKKLHWGSWLGACSAQIPDDKWAHFREDTFGVIRIYLPAQLRTAPRSMSQSASQSSAQPSGQFQASTSFAQTGQSQFPNQQPFQFMHPQQSFSQSYPPSYPPQASSSGQQYATPQSGSGQYGQSYGSHGSQITQQQGPSTTTSASGSGSGQVTFSHPAPSAPARVLRTTLNTPNISPRDANNAADSNSMISPLAPMGDIDSFIADNPFNAGGAS